MKLLHSVTVVACLVQKTGSQRKASLHRPRPNEAREGKRSPQASRGGQALRELAKGSLVPGHAVAREGSDSPLRWGRRVMISLTDRYWSRGERASVVPPISELWEVGERAGSTCAIEVKGLRRRPRTVGGRPRP